MSGLAMSKYFYAWDYLKTILVLFSSRLSFVLIVSYHLSSIAVLYLFVLEFLWAVNFLFQTFLSAINAKNKSDSIITQVQKSQNFRFNMVLRLAKLNFVS
jgi:hypothetical protein